MHADRPSLTASLVAALRALYTEMPEPYRLASDPYAASLVHGLLALPAKAMARAPWAAGAVHRGLGLASFGLSYHVALRTRAIDEALHAAVARGATQVVVLGAGLDSRALRLDALAKARVFEVDYPSTQRYKVERLEALSRNARSAARAVTRVAIDFERQRIDEVLPAQGFDAGAPSFWIWEGVTVYLTPEAIRATLRSVAALSAPGSRLALTYTTNMREDDLAGMLIPLARSALHLVGEPIHTLFEPAQMGRELRDTGFEVLSDESTIDWARRFWPGLRGVRAIERLAVAERQVERADSKAA